MFIQFAFIQGMITDKYPLYRPDIGISHRGTLVGVHPTIPWFICCGFVTFSAPWISPLFHHHRHLPSLCATSKPMTLICRSLGVFNIWGCGGWFLMICLMNSGPYSTGLWRIRSRNYEPNSYYLLMCCCGCCGECFSRFFWNGYQRILQLFLGIFYTMSG